MRVKRLFYGFFEGKNARTEIQLEKKLTKLLVFITISINNSFMINVW